MIAQPATDRMTQRRQAAWRAVDRGARMLDARIPDWFTILDLERFNIGSGQNCVIGQLARVDMADLYAQVGREVGSGDFSVGIALLMDEADAFPQNDDPMEVARRRSDRRRDWGAQHGFDLPYTMYLGYDYGWGDVQEAWIWQIAKRRGLPADIVAASSWYCEAMYGIKHVTVPWPDGEVPAPVD
jgi:hypothetical protein